MDPQQVRNTQALFRRHMEALELAVKLGQEYEQALALSSGAPAKQDQPSGSAYTTVSVEAESELSKDADTQALEEPLLPTRTFSRTMSARHSGKHTEVEIARSLDCMKKEVMAQAHKRKSVSLTAKEEKFREDHYQDKGIAQELKRGRRFNFICFVVILVNAIWVAVVLDHGGANHPEFTGNWMVHLFDQIILAWFLFELVVWFFAFQSTYKALTYWWFDVHAIIVALMMWSLWVDPFLDETLLELIGYRGFALKNISFLTVMRLERTARTSGLLRNRPELTLYTTAVFQGIRSISTVLVLYAITVYIFTMIFKALLGGRTHTFAQNFSTVPKAYHWLFLTAFASVNKGNFDSMLKAGWIPWCLFCVFTLIGNLTVAKMLTGILLQVVKKLVDKEKQKTDTEFLESTIETVATKLDTDQSGWLSKAEFQTLMKESDLVESMTAHHVDVAGFIDFTLFYFPADGKLYVHDLIRSAKQFCGFKPASVMDMMNLRKLIYLETNALSETLEQVGADVRELMYRESEKQAARRGSSLFG